MRQQIIKGLGLLLCSSLISSPLLAQSNSAAIKSYPEKPIKLVIPYPPGGATDVIGRIMAQELTKSLNQQVIPDNRAGDSGNIGADMVAKSPADGYTLLIAPSPLVIIPSLYRNMRFDPIKDLAPVSKLIVIPQILVAHPSLPAKTLKELMALARAKPGQLDYGAGAYGGHGHMSMALLLTMTGLNINYVPYRSGSGPLVAVVSGEAEAAAS